MIFSIQRSVFGPKNCHCSRSVNLTGVTVSGEACIRSVGLGIEYVQVVPGDTLLLLLDSQ